MEVELMEMELDAAQGFGSLGRQEVAW